MNQQQPPAPDSADLTATTELPTVAVDTGVHVADQPDVAADEPQRSRFHHLWQVLSWLLLIVCFGILAITIVVPRATGSQAYTVLTGSMKPNYPPGTLIVVKPVDPAQLTVGDVITYQVQSGDPAVVTHRIIEVTQNADGEPRFRTQGDANNAVDDELVRPIQIRGRLWYSVPYLGYVNTWFNGQKRTLAIFLLAGLFFVYAAWQFYAAYREERNEPDPDPDDPNSDPDDGGPGNGGPDNGEAATEPLAVQGEGNPA